MEYRTEVSCRTPRGYVGAVLVSLLFGLPGFLGAWWVYSTPVLIFWTGPLGFLCLQLWWCLIVDRRWRVSVVDGTIGWDSAFLRRPRALALAEIAGVVRNTDAPGQLFYLSRGAAVPQPFAFPIYGPWIDQDSFLAAIAQAAPHIRITSAPLGRDIAG